MKNKCRVLIIGAGSGGTIMSKELLAHSDNYIVIGFIDDDPSKKGTKIDGIKVLGNVQDLDKVVNSHKTDEILIAIPSASSEQMRLIIEKCKNFKLPIKTMPRLIDIFSGRTKLTSLTLSH